VFCIHGRISINFDRNGCSIEKESKEANYTIFIKEERIVMIRNAEVIIVRDGQLRVGVVVLVCRSARLLCVGFRFFDSGGRG
jgi:hypothetical protein